MKTIKIKMDLNNPTHLNLLSSALRSGHVTSKGVTKAHPTISRAHTGKPAGGPRMGPKGGRFTLTKTGRKVYQGSNPKIMRFRRQQHVVRP